MINCAVVAHLVEEEFPPLLPSQVHLLDGHLSTGRLFGGDAHDARRSFADFDETLQVGARVARTDDHLQRRAELFVGETLLLLLLLLLHRRRRHLFPAAATAAAAATGAGGDQRAFAGVERVLILIGRAVVVHRRGSVT